MKAEKAHRAYVMGIIGSPYRWCVVCDQCPWLGELEGPWVDSKEANRRARAHANDPDIERKAAEYAALWGETNYDELSDDELEEQIDQWFERLAQYDAQKRELTGTGEEDRLWRLASRAHVRASQGIREQRRRENRGLRALEQQRDSQCDEEGGRA